MSFLGFGLPPGVPSWGGMLSREGRQYMEMAPRLAIWPGLCLTVVVYSINMFGDALRDLLDPACAAASAASDAHRVRSPRRGVDHGNSIVPEGARLRARAAETFVTCSASAALNAMPLAGKVAMNTAAGSCTFGKSTPR